ncbi:MAG: DNA alkylation repair protein [Acholeplasma sp.]|jgi:3-methyladenine DNA glycosylase AlkD|nr:DNA alkylation repair protein [Acholeplasma sp.]
MELNKAIWLEEDRYQFLDFLKSFAQLEKVEWSQRILNSKMDVLAIPTKTLHQIATSISKGNYVSFLDLKIFDYYESVALYGMILCKIKDFELMRSYLTVYLDVMENWAHVDLLSLSITKTNQEDFIRLSYKYLKDPRPFVRRLSLMILFQMRKTPSILPIVFGHIQTLKDENEYYVIMMAGWLLSECIILYRDDTLHFLNSHDNLNKKIVNKGIQKCRESRRFTLQEKEDLLQYKR